MIKGHGSQSDLVECKCLLCQHILANQIKSFIRNLLFEFMEVYVSRRYSKGKGLKNNMRIQIMNVISLHTIYNRSNTIKRCLESINYNFKNYESFEIIIVDDN